jgi:isopentenyl diphosphate isomerase/L-lactate dehydrogenase-like FMN-dependent dehydrogenase
MPDVPASETAAAPALTRDHALFRRFPNIAMMRAAARRRLPRFAFEYLDGGAGADGGIARNRHALDAIELVPRAGRTIEPPPIATELLGRRYSAPIGVAPMGSPSVGFPGADRILATAAQRARLPYTLSAVGGMTIEEAAAVAPDVLWFQLPRLARDDHKLGRDLVRRAHEAGAHALVLTMDTPTSHDAAARGGERGDDAVSRGPAHAAGHPRRTGVVDGDLAARRAALRQLPPLRAERERRRDGGILRGQTAATGHAADMPKSTRMTQLPLTIQDRLVYICDYDAPNSNAVAAWPAP